MATAVNAHGGPHGRLDFESETFVAHAPGRTADDADSLVAGTLNSSIGRGTGAAHEVDFLVAPTVPSRSTAGGGLGTDFDCDGGLVAGTLDGRNCAHPSGLKNEPDVMVPTVVHALRADGFDASEDGTGRDTPLVTGFYHTNRQPEFGNYDGVSPPVKVGSNGGGQPPAVAHTLREYTRNNSNPATEAMQHVTHGMAVRRLTPRECCRLQGFPDDYLDIAYRGKPAADGPRYRALGNAMAVNVMRWIGMRIQLVEDLTLPG